MSCHVLAFTAVLRPRLPTKKAAAVWADLRTQGTFFASLFFHLIRRDVLINNFVCCRQVEGLSAAQHFRTVTFATWRTWLTGSCEQGWG